MHKYKLQTLCFYHDLLPERQSHGFVTSCFSKGNLTSERLGENRQKQTCLQSLQLEYKSKLSYDFLTTFSQLSDYDESDKTSKHLESLCEDYWEQTNVKLGSSGRNTGRSLVQGIETSNKARVC